MTGILHTARISIAKVIVNVILVKKDADNILSCSQTQAILRIYRSQSSLEFLSSNHIKCFCEIKLQCSYYKYKLYTAILSMFLYSVMNIFKGDLNLDGVNKLVDQLGGLQNLTSQMSTTAVNGHGLSNWFLSWTHTGSGLQWGRLRTVIWQLNTSCWFNACSTLISPRIFSKSHSSSRSFCYT